MKELQSIELIVYLCMNGGVVDLHEPWVLGVLGLQQGANRTRSLSVQVYPANCPCDQDLTQSLQGRCRHQQHAIELQAKFCENIGRGIGLYDQQRILSLQQDIS